MNDGTHPRQTPAASPAPASAPASAPAPVFGGTVPGVTPSPAPAPAPAEGEYQVFETRTIDRALGVGMVYAARWTQSVVGPSITQSEWNGIDKVDSTGDGGEVVARYMQCNLDGARPGWAGVSEICDMSFGAKYAPMNSHEFDVWCAGDDPAGWRNGQLIVVGDGPQRALLEHDLPHAIFCGTQRGEELARHYASGDLFLFPSLTETFGNVVLEAMASGLAVVAYDQAAATQHIRHGYNGVLAMPGDEEAFCDAANWLLEDREHLRRARLNARHHASHQGWPAIIEQFENQLRDVCAEPLAAPTQPYVR